MREGGGEGARPGKIRATCHFIHRCKLCNVVATFHHECEGEKKKLKSLSCTQQSQFRHTLHYTATHIQRKQREERLRESYERTAFSRRSMTAVRKGRL
uniref:Uncharacterized protein n=1 Tax=Rhipicephalus zambeziensis TaxID=60191 RepID=A0A224YLP3_9ACAR